MFINPLAQNVSTLLPKPNSFQTRKFQAPASERPDDADTDGQQFVYLVSLLAIIVVARVQFLHFAAVQVDGLSFWDLAPAIALLLPLSLFTGLRGFARTTLALRGLCAYVLVLSYAPDTCAAVFHSGRAFPLVDKGLDAFDKAIGFDWMAYARLFDRQSIVWRVAAFCYESINYQPILVILALAWASAAGRMYAFCLAHALALTIVAFIACFFPAVGAFDYFDTAHAGFLHQNFATATLWTKPIFWLREEALSGKGVDFFSLISFPSFHAASAVIFVWATWRVRCLRFAFLILNLGLLAATPAQGSHYLSDVIAGIAVASFAVLGSVYVIGTPNRFAIGRRCFMRALRRIVFSPTNRQSQAAWTITRASDEQVTKRAAVAE